MQIFGESFVPAAIPMLLSAVIPSPKRKLSDSKIPKCSLQKKRLQFDSAIPASGLLSSRYSPPPESRYCCYEVLMLKKTDTSFRAKIQDGNSADISSRICFFIFLV